ncbi:MAG: TonB-dependent receptor [Acidobacteria bacterium]|nr:TonB-dependent receptor [Acidobacteriota bacterium]
MRLRGTSVWVALLMLVWLVPSVALGQTTDRSGIEGKIVDQSGGVLPGVSITVSSPAMTGGSRSVVTDGEGLFRFAALPAGTYEVVFELAGFSTLKRSVRLDTGFIATINESMGVGGLEESLTVNAISAVVDIRTTSVSTNLGKEALEALPTSRSMWQVMNLAPGLRVSGADVGGTAVGTQQAYSNYGTSTGGNKPSIDGVDTREDAGGAGFYYDYGAFQEVQIKAMGADAEMPTPGTQFIGILKSGTDQFHGSGSFGWETPRLQASNVTDDLRARGVSDGNPLKSYHDGNVDLGGPVLKGRAWFYGSYRHQEIRTGVLGYFTSPGEPGEYHVTLTNLTGKVTAQAGQKHRFSSFVQAQEKDYPERNADGFRFKESTWHQIFKPLAGKGEWSWMVSDRTFFNAYVGRWKYVTDGINHTEAPAAYDTVTLRYAGRFLTTPYVGGRARWQYNTNVSHYVSQALGGSHEFKAGLEITDESRTYDATEDSPGRDYQLRFQNGVPFQVVAYNYPYSSLGKMTTQSAFVRDAWRFGNRVTLNLGLRYESYDIYLPEQSKGAGRFYPAGDFERQDVLTWRNWAPRVGLSLPLDRSNRTVLKATYGWYNFATQTNYSDTYNRNAAQTTTYRWNDLNGNRDYDDGEFGTFVSATGASASVNNPDLGQPKTHEITTSLERQVAANFSARVSYVYRKEVDRFQSVNVARPFDAYSIPTTTKDPGPDGVLNTADDGGAVTYYDYTAAYAGSAFVRNMNVNPDGYDNSYNSFEVAAQKRMSNKWQLVTSFLATKVDTWRNGIPQDPNAANFFPKSEYWEWNFKASGSYELPWGVQAAAMFTSQSGAVWAREARFTTGLARLGSLILLMEDPAARRLPTQNLLNVRIEKRQKIGFGTAALQLDVFNVTNTNVELGVTARSGSTFGQITSIVPPMIAKLGVTYTF